MPDIEPIPDGIGDDDEFKRLIGIGERYRNQEARQKGLPLPGPNTPPNDPRTDFLDESTGKYKCLEIGLSDFSDPFIRHGSRDVEWFEPKNYHVPYLTGEPPKDGHNPSVQRRIATVPDPTPKRHIAVVKPKEIDDEMTTHKLKTWTEHFEPLALEEKSVEIRFNDRKFRVGDILILEDYNPISNEYTGRSEVRVVAHIIDNPAWLQPGYVAMSVRKPR